jgi:hypothetical protein
MLSRPRFRRRSGNTLNAGTMLLTTVEAMHEM